jgi:hypothetical protein
MSEVQQNILQRLLTAVPRSKEQLHTTLRVFYEAVKKFGFVKALLILYVCTGLFWSYLRQKGWWFKKSIRGEHAYVTGAGSGIGRGISLRLA